MQIRSLFEGASRSAPPVSTRLLEPASGAAGDAALHYLGERGLLLRGPRTGRVYHGDPEHPVLSVDEKDVDMLLRTGLFARPELS